MTTMNRQTAKNFLFEEAYCALVEKSDAVLDSINNVETQKMMRKPILRKQLLRKESFRWEKNSVIRWSLLYKQHHGPHHLPAGLAEGSHQVDGGREVRQTGAVCENEGVDTWCVSRAGDRTVFWDWKASLFNFGWNWLKDLCREVVCEETDRFVLSHTRWGYLAGL